MLASGYYYTAISFDNSGFSHIELVVLSFLHVIGQWIVKQLLPTVSYGFCR